MRNGNECIWHGHRWIARSRRDVRATHAGKEQGVKFVILECRVESLRCRQQNVLATIGVIPLAIRAYIHLVSRVEIGLRVEAGLAAGDELLALGDWRLRRLDDALRLLVDAVPAPLLVARDQRVLRLSLTLPAASQGVGAVALVLAENAKPAALALRKAWLGG